MCGIVAYTGKTDSARPLEVVLAGLERLEYRGYDSAGVAVANRSGISVRKKAGRVADLKDALGTEPLPDGLSAIGHTRWATHGSPTAANAHPHMAPDGSVAIVHNGIVENHEALRAELAATGSQFLSETDTEVVAHLLGKELAQTPDLTEAMLAVVNRLEGSFAIVAVAANQPEKVVAARRNSPLVVGLGDGENFLGSDVAAFVGFTRRALAIGQDQIV